LVALLALAPASVRADVPEHVAPLPPRPAAPAGMYRNPMDVRGADPFVYHEGDTYYLYATSAGDGIRQWTSKDLVHWERRGYAYRRDEASWGRRNFWAPELFKHHGKYYLHFTAQGDENPSGRRIVLAVADSPLGPFKQVGNGPWFDDHTDTIDSDVFQDPTDGQLYLYVVHFNHPPEGKNFEIVARKLKDDLMPEKEVTFCTTPDQKWEGKPVNEGPFVMKHGGTYFLTYSTFGYENPKYCVCVARAKSPLGPWTKQGRILQRTEGTSGTGHHCFTESPDGKELFIVYHEHRDLDHPGGDRVIAIDRAHFVDGPTPTIKVDGPTLTPQRLPSGSPPVTTAAADAQPVRR
jgi:beta-xylosidase